MVQQRAEEELWGGVEAHLPLHNLLTTIGSLSNGHWLASSCLCAQWQKGHAMVSTHPYTGARPK